MDTSKTETVKFIYDLYLSGSSLRKIADALYEKEILSPTGKDRWAVQVIGNLLSNKLYLHIVPSELFVQVQLEKQRRSNINLDNTRKTVRYTSGNVLSGLMVCKECGKNYRRITRKDSKVVWRCADRVENDKQATCQNFHTITDTEIKQAICDYLGINYFDEDAVKEEICRVEIASDSIEFVNHMDQLFSVSM